MIRTSVSQRQLMHRMPQSGPELRNILFKADGAKAKPSSLPRKCAHSARPSQARICLRAPVVRKQRAALDHPVRHHWFVREQADVMVTGLAPIANTAGIATACPGQTEHPLDAYSIEGGHA